VADAAGTQSNEVGHDGCADIFNSKQLGDDDMHRFMDFRASIARGTESAEKGQKPNSGPSGRTG
jgi:hypothetical protein